MHHVDPQDFTRISCMALTSEKVADPCVVDGTLDITFQSKLKKCIVNNSHTCTVLYYRYVKYKSDIFFKICVSGILTI